MCGRYAAGRQPDQLMEQFHIDHDGTGGRIPAPSYNVAPTTDVLTVVQAHDRRELKVMRWGLVPSWSKDTSMASHMINARSETAATKPSFRHAFAKQRCLIPADGFYEWHTPDADDPDAKIGKTGKVLKQPYFIRPADHTSLPMAGLYELWRDPSRVGQANEVLITCTILTTSATANFEAIHDRMPMTVTADAWEAWLDPDLQDRNEVAGLMKPAGQLELQIYPVSTAVNAVANNGPRLIDPLGE